MTARQLDLFSEGATSAEHRPPRAMSRQEALVPASLEDAALIEAIPDAGIANAPQLAAEAGRRRLAAAVPALERLCRRFLGFGSYRTIPEQVAAVEALAIIAGLRGRAGRQGTACSLAKPDKPMLPMPPDGPMSEERHEGVTSCESPEVCWP